MEISDKTAQFLLKLARQSIEYFLETKNVLPIENVKIPSDVNVEVMKKNGAFVLLEILSNEHRKGYIRGENGLLESVEEVGKLVTQIAVNAAFFDSQTPRLKPYELNELVIHLFIPSERQKLLGDYATVVSRIDSENEGVIIETRGRTAHSLPIFVGDVESGEHRLRSLRLRLGIKKKDAENNADYYVFSGQHFIENT